MAKKRDDTPADKRTMIDQLFQHSREMLFVVGPDGRFACVNPAWRDVTGWAEDELVGAYVSQLTHPDDLAELGAAVERLAAHGSSENVARMRMKDGAWRWFEARAQVTEDGLIVGSMRDATAERARAEELDEARRTRLLLSEAAGVGTWTFDPLAEVVSWSPEILALTGYDEARVSRAEFIGRLHPDERDTVRAAFGESVTTGRPNSLEHRLLRKDGRWITLRSTFRTRPSRRGFHTLEGISQDVTELAAARDGARQGEQQIRQLVESAPFAVAMMDRQLRCLVVSPRWADTFGAAGGDPIGRTLSDAFPSVPPTLRQACREAANGEVSARAEDTVAGEHGGEGERIVRWETRPWRDARGRIAGVLAYVDDVSEISLARLEAQTNSRRLKMALAAADAGVYEVDHVEGAFWASPELQRMIGAADGYEAVRALAFPHFHPDDVEHVRAAFLAIHRGLNASGEGFEARVIGPDGAERWVRIYHHLTKDASGRWLKAVGLVQDVDAAKRQELALIEAERAAQAAAEAKAAFLANMSHEIRTPMNGVLGVLHLLKSEALSDEGRKLLDEALSCGQMLAELLNDVIDFSKIEAGHLELAFEAVDPKALVDGVVSLLRPQAAAKGLEVLVDIDERVGWIWSDPVRLRQALFNLIGNAVKFTLQGHVRISCSARQGLEGPRLRFEIADTGVGVPQAAQSRLFQRFDQGDASTTRKFGGSGLGLAITKRLAEIMGGEVGFTSTEGVGSTFWIEVAAEPAEAVEAKVETPEAVLEGLHILVVEDNPTNRLIATKLLEGLGASVETAEDGASGVEAAEWGMFDLILMDVQMPGMDGLEATRRIRALPDSAARTPIIALTANVLAHQQREYRAAGMDGVVGKPISPEALLAEIARLSRDAEPLDASNAA